MGSQRRTQPQPPAQNMAVTPAAQAISAIDAGGMDPAGTPNSGYDALAESRKRIALAAAQRRSLFAQALPGSALAAAPAGQVLGAG